MSTRRLIALALACGLAILVAGGVWLVLASRGSDDDLVASFLPEGATAEVGGLVVGVTGSRLADGVLVLDVQMVGGAEAAGAPGRSWGVISGRGLGHTRRFRDRAGGDCLPAANRRVRAELSCRRRRAHG